MASCDARWLDHCDLPFPSSACSSTAPIQRAAPQNFVKLLVAPHDDYKIPAMAINGVNGIVHDEDIDAEIDYSDIEAKCASFFPRVCLA